MKTMHAKAIIEILGSPEEHVVKTMAMVLEKLKQTNDIKVLQEARFDPKKMENQPLWSTFTELDLEAKDLPTLVGFCFDFMPSSLEIITPEDLHVKHHVISDFLNDLLARLHQYDMVLKQVHAQNILLKKEMDKRTKKA